MLCLKKDIKLKLSVTLSNLNRFSNLCTAGKRTKFAIKPIRHYPSYLSHVATLPWEIKNSNFLQMWTDTQTNCIFITSNFVIHHQVLIFSVFKIASFLPILIAN